MAGNAADAGRSVTSKVAGILLNFASGSDYSLSEIARRTGMPVSTTHRLVTELQASGVLVRTGQSCYRSGAQLRRIARHDAPVIASLHERARRVVEDLAAAFPGRTADLGVVEGFEVAFLEKADSTGPVSTFFQIGTQPPHATAIGKALLAFAAPKIADRVLKGPLRRYTRSTIVCPEQAVPVFGPGNTVPVALQLSSRTSADTRLVLPALKMAAARCPMSCTFTTRYAVVTGTERTLDVMLRCAFLAGQLDARVADGSDVRATDMRLVPPPPRVTSLRSHIVWRGTHEIPWPRTPS